MNQEAAIKIYNTTVVTAQGGVVVTAFGGALAALGAPLYVKADDKEGILNAVAALRDFADALENEHA
jgi:hypothetical protein